MLDLRIELQDEGASFARAGKGVEFGRSRIAAFASDHIFLEDRDAKGVKEIWIGEDGDPFPPEDPVSARLDSYRSFQSYEGLKVFHYRVDRQPVIEIARTRAGGCPIYVAAGKDWLAASWKFDEVALSISDRKPNIEACRTFLKYGARPIRQQILDGMFMLWPGESVSFDQNGLKFRQADTPDIVLPGALRESARATDLFLELIAEALERNLSRAVNPLIEVSGGFDSSCVALAAASIREGLNSYAVVHQGAIGIQQRKRRRELVELLGLNDFEGPSFTPAPFASLQVDECTMTPLDDMYRLPCVYAVDAHPVKDIDLVITGIGGDELTMEHTFHREEWEVAGSICSSAADAAAGRADMFMRRGIWLTQPYVSQTIVDFCRALPKKMRAGRILNILTLARAGLSDGFLFPRYAEHYANVIKQEAALLDFDAAFSESAVADLGVCEISTPLARAREATGDGLPVELIVELWLLLKLEVILRRYAT